MGENSKIEWTTHTFNPWRGCTKVAAGCAHCYADRLAIRNPGTLGIWGEDGTRVLASESMWREPIKWNKAAGEAGVRARVFCASMADVFEDWNGQMRWADGSPAINRFSEEPYRLGDARAELFKLIDATPHLDWLLLTKRPENIRRMWPTPSNSPCRDGRGNVSHDFMGSRCLKCNHPKRRHNVWLGTSIATQEDADRNIPELLKCRDLSPVLFVSAEPLLGEIDLRKVSTPAGDRDVLFVGDEGGYEYAGSPRNFLNWLIVGGESGPKARPMHPAWARSLRDQCQAAGVPFFFKQWGEWAPWSVWPEGEARPDRAYGEFHNRHADSWVDSCFCSEGTEPMHHIGKAAAGRLLDGREWNEMPAVEVPA